MCDLDDTGVSSTFRVILSAAALARMLFHMPLSRLFSAENNKGEDQGKEKCHAKSMMSKETNERLKRDTQHVPLRQNIYFSFLLFFFDFFFLFFWRAVDGSTPY